jgi:hypothetical protein
MFDKQTSNINVSISDAKSQVWHAIDRSIDVCAMFDKIISNEDLIVSHAKSQIRLPVDRSIDVCSLFNEIFRMMRSIPKDAFS